MADRARALFRAHFLSAFVPMGARVVLIVPVEIVLVKIGAVKIVSMKNRAGQETSSFEG
jgi:hypothetical protein